MDDPKVEIWYRPLRPSGERFEVVCGSMHRFVESEKRAQALATLYGRAVQGPDFVS